MQLQITAKMSLASQPGTHIKHLQRFRNQCQRRAAGFWAGCPLIVERTARTVSEQPAQKPAARR
ncbi:hypothetical protein A8B98_18890 [Hymenobacter sp. UV11]|nr:hypothetical protein A8B98_18890 [Hymenobacter sp. UV11]